MVRVYVSSVINAPIEQVWDYLRDFNALPKWFPSVTDSNIEGGMRADQVECIRNFGLQGGARMREQLLALSDVNHTWTYKMIEGPIPISNYVPTFRLLPVTDGNVTFAEGAVRFDCAKEQEGEMSAFFSNAYQSAFNNVKQHFSGAKAAKS
jgi:ligand-binding SRPBCC domain-containing protein